MSGIKVVHEEIGRFLESKAPEVLCLKGKWGVGKTYAWNHYVREVAQRGRFGLGKYAYVSLFGLNSLEDVKYALFEATLTENDLQGKPTLSSLEKSFGWVKRYYRKGVALASKNPFAQSYLGTTERSLFFFVRDQIVCIDDLERAGDGLTTKDVFGLVSYLKEQRGCKVALLLNEEKLPDRPGYDELLEKVVDTKLHFSPTSKEAADIVFLNPLGTQGLIHKDCVALGITNIRVIKKIERIVSRFEEIFGKESPLMTQVTHSATIFAWSVYQPDEAPPLDFLTDLSKLHGLGLDKTAISEKERSWQELARIYGYSNTDDFDSKIIETIKNGYFDVDGLKEAGEKQLGNTAETNSKNEFEKAWNLYHYSFDHNEKAVLDALYNTAKKAAKSIEPMNLDSTVTFLKEFGRDEDARNLVKYYVEIRGGEKELFDFKRSFFSRDIKDPDLIAAFDKQKESFKDKRNPAQLLVDIYTNRGWNPEDIALLKALSTDDFYKIFKDTQGLDLHRIIKAALDFGKFSDASEDMKTISQTAKMALQKVGKENKLNAKRVATHGIKPEEGDGKV